MTMTRLLTAAAAVALFAGPVAAQTTSTPSTGRPVDASKQASGQPVTDDTVAGSATTTSPAGNTTPEGEINSSAANTTGTPQRSGAQNGSMSGSMQSQGSMNAGGAMGATASGNMNAGGSIGTTASGNMNAGGTVGSSMAGGGMTTSMNGGVRVVSNAPIPDTAENRARYGQPESGGGRSRIGEGPTTELRGSARARTRR